MVKQEWIGVQFNFDKDIGLEDWIKRYERMGITSDGEHITIDFGKKELKRLGSGESKKIKILKTAVKKFLKYSCYTNIYTYLNAEDLTTQKPELLKGEFSKILHLSKKPKALGKASGGSAAWPRP